MGALDQFGPRMLQLNAQPQGFPTNPIGQAQAINPFMTPQMSATTVQPTLAPTPLAAQGQGARAQAANPGALPGREQLINKGMTMLNNPQSAAPNMSQISDILKVPGTTPDDPNSPLFDQRYSNDRAIHEGAFTGFLKGMNQTGSPLQQFSKMAGNVFTDIRANQKDIRDQKLADQAMALKRAEGGMNMMKLQNEMSQGDRGLDIEQVKAYAKMAEVLGPNTPMLKNIKAALGDKLLSSPEGLAMIQKQLNKKNGVNVDINTGEKNVTNRFKEDIDFIQKNAQSARRGISVNNQMIDLLADGMETGAGQKLLFPAKKLLAGFLGMDPEQTKRLDQQTMFDMLTSDNVLGAAEKMTGTISDADMQFLKESQASLGNTKGANVTMLQYTLALSERNRDAYKEWKSWRRKTKEAGGDVSDEAASNHMDDWMDSRSDINKIVTDKAKVEFDKLSKKGLDAPTISDRLTKRFGTHILRSLYAQPAEAN